MEPEDILAKKELTLSLRIFFFILCTVSGVVSFILLAVLFRGGWLALLSTPFLLAGLFIVLILLAIDSLLLWIVQRPDTQVTKGGSNGHYYFDL